MRTILAVAPAAALLLLLTACADTSNAPASGSSPVPPIVSAPQPEPTASPKPTPPALADSSDTDALEYRARHIAEALDQWSASTGLLPTPGQEASSELASLVQVSKTEGYSIAGLGSDGTWSGEAIIIQSPGGATCAIELPASPEGVSALHCDLSSLQRTAEMVSKVLQAWSAFSEQPLAPGNQLDELSLSDIDIALEDAYTLTGLDKKGRITSTVFALTRESSPDSCEITAYKPEPGSQMQVECWPGAH